MTPMMTDILCVFSDRTSSAFANMGELKLWEAVSTLHRPETHKDIFLAENLRVIGTITPAQATNVHGFSEAIHHAMANQYFIPVLAPIGMDEQELSRQMAKRYSSFRPSRVWNGMLGSSVGSALGSVGLVLD